MNNSTLSILVVKENTLIAENVNVVDGPVIFENVITNNLNIENGCVELGSSLEIEVL
jgi:hypothetical protein